MVCLMNVMAVYCMLMTQTVHAMQMMLCLCDKFADDFDIKINCRKPVAIRIGKLLNKKCVTLQFDLKDISLC